MITSSDQSHLHPGGAALAVVQAFLCHIFEVGEIFPFLARSLVGTALLNSFVALARRGNSLTSLIGQLKTILFDFGHNHPSRWTIRDGPLNPRKLKLKICRVSRPFAQRPTTLPLFFTYPSVCQTSSKVKRPGKHWREEPS